MTTNDETGKEKGYVPDREGWIGPEYFQNKPSVPGDIYTGKFEYIDLFAPVSVPISESIPLEDDRDDKSVSIGLPNGVSESSLVRLGLKP